MTYTVKATEIIEVDDLLPSGKLPRLHPKTFHQLSDAKVYADKLAARLAEREPDSRFVVEVEEKKGRAKYRIEIDPESEVRRIALV